MTDMRDTLEEILNGIGDLEKMVDGIACFTNRVSFGQGKEELMLVYSALLYLQKDLEGHGKEAWDTWHAMEKDKPKEGPTLVS